MSKVKLRITIEGDYASGKTQAARIIADDLYAKGFNVIVEDAGLYGSKIHPPCSWYSGMHRRVTVHLRTKQTSEDLGQCNV